MKKIFYLLFLLTLTSELFAQTFGTSQTPVSNVSAFSARHNQKIVNGNPAFVYLDATSRLMYVRATNAAGTAWGTPVVLETAASSFGNSNLEIINGKPAVAYSITGSSIDVRFKTAIDANGDTWNSFVTVNSSLLTQSDVTLCNLNNRAAIAFRYNSNGTIYYSLSNTTLNSFGSPVLVASAVSANHINIKVVNSNPAISYQNSTNQDLHFVRSNDANGSAWGGIVTVDALGNAGNSSSLEIVNGNPALAYVSDNNLGTNYRELRYIRANDVNGSTWGSPQTLHAEANNEIGYYASLSIINGVPAIAYQHGTTGDLMYIKASDSNGSVWGSPVVVDNSIGLNAGKNISLTQIGTRASIAYLNKAGINGSTGDAKYIQESQRYYVKANATGTNNGSSWANAFTSLQSALAVAASGDEVWVAAGTYKPHASSRSTSFVIPSGLKVYGGFAGNESTLASRNMTLINTTNQTTLSGDLSGNDAGLNNRSENSYRVVTFLNAVSTTTLDGFRILGGNNTLGEVTAGFGGGIYNNGSGSGKSSNPTIANCTITYCSAFLGGGMYNDGTNGGNASPSITNCIFISNSADDSGAGLANYGTSGNSSPTISRCSFIGNSSVFNSGAINNHGESGICSPTITNCVFMGNYAANNGGAMVNTGTNGGTCIPNITNCSFSGNSATGVGGVIRNNAANPVIKNSIMWGNSSIFDNNGGSVTATYSIVEGGYTGTGNLSTNPLFVSLPSFASAPTITGDLHLTASSPAINKGTNTGAPTTDLDGNTRPFTGTITDMGAYEFQGLGGCTQVATATETMTWNGSISTDWNNPCNWSPNGIPGAGNFVLIPTGLTKYPIVDNNVSMTQLSINEGASLTVNASKTLTLVGNGSSQSSCNGTINNNGTISITQNSTNNPIIFATNGVLNNNLGATFTIVTTSNSGLICNNNALINNFGTLNVTGGSISLYLYTAHSASELVKNYGTMNLSGNIEKNANTFRNYACGKIYLNVGDFYNRNSDVINEGYLFVANLVNNISGNFTNNGVLKYNTSLGNITNTGNGAVIVKNTPTPIFTYGGTYDGVVNGIFTNVGATTSAGTFTAPNTFMPSGLPVGSQTLYAKITPSGGACSYVVPFTYNYAAPPTLTAGAVTNAPTCNGNGSIAFTTTNVPNGNYSLFFTPSGTATATTSPQTVTVTNNAFTLAVKSGSYNDFSMNVAGQIASTGTLTPAKTVSSPVPLFQPSGSVTNPTTCGGSNGIIPFTASGTGIPDGTYSLSFTPTGTGATSSPQNVTVSANAFSLTGLKAGNYSNFQMTVLGCGSISSFQRTLTDPTPPTLTAGTSVNPTTCGGTGSVAFTSTNLPNGTYSLSFTVTGAGATTSPQSITVSGNAFTLTGLKAGTYSDFSVTSSGCTGSVATSKVIADPAAPTLTAGTATNPTTCGGANGSIPFTSTNLPNGTYSLSFTATGAGATTSPQSITVSGNAFTLTGLKAGTYSAFSVTSAGCTGTVATSKILTDPAAPTLTVGTSTNPTTCGGANGSIPFTSTNLPNGTYSLSFTATGAGATTSPQSITVLSNAFTLTGLKAGTYSAFSVTNVGCTGTAATSKVLADPATPTLTVGTSVNPSTCGGANGSIPFTSTNLPNGTYSLSFTATGTGATTSPQSVTVSGNAFSLTGLKAGTYSNFSLTTLAGCTGTVATPKTLTDPTAPTLTAGTATNPTTCGGTGSIAFTSTNLPNGTYSLSFTGTGSPKNVTVSANTFTLSGLTAGTYSNFFLTTAAGCTGTVATPKTLADPASPTLVAGTSVNPTTCGGVNGSIPFTSTNLPNGTYSLSFTSTGTGATTSPQNITVSANAFSLTGLKAGNYSNFSLTTLAGCTGTVATSKVLTDPAAPTLTAGTSVNPTTCGGTNGSIPFTSTNLPNGTYSLSFTATGTGATTSPKSITVSANTFSLTGLKAGTYSNFSVTSAGCTGSDAISKILTDPATPTISAGTVVNPATCGATGSIPFTATNLPNGTYSLSFTATGTGATSSPRNVTVASNAFSLTGLSVGSYSNFSLTSTGCIGTDATSKTIVNPITPTLVAGTAVNPTSCGGTDGAIPFTTNLPDGTYSLTYTGTGSPKSITVSSGAFTLGTLGSGGYSNFSVTNNGCIGTLITSKSLSDPAAPVLTLGATTNPSACNLADGSIAFTTTNIADGTYSLNYSGAGNPKSVTVSANAFTLSGLSDGVYSNFSITNESGCTGSLSSSVTLVDLALPVLTVGTATNPTTCAGTQGTIAFTTANLPDGTYSLTFSSTGTPSPQNITVASNAFTLSGLSAGTYNNFSVTRLGCTGSVSTSKVLVDPATPTVTAGVSASPSTCAGTDGSINFTTTNLANGTYSLSFISTGTVSPKNVTVTNNVFTLSGLTAGNYSNFSITNNGCSGTDATLKTLTDPPSITLAVGSSTNPTTCAGTNGSINFTTTNLPNGTYTLTYTGAGSPKTVTVATNAFTISDLSAGAYSNFSITYLGCTGSDAQTKTLFDPESATITAGTVSSPSTCNGTDGSIAFTATNLPDGNYSLAYTGTGSPQTVTVSGNTFTLTGLSAGSYSNFSLVSSGCTAIDPSTKSLVAPTTPTLTAGTVTNPSTCNGTDGSIAFTTNLADGTYSLAYTGAGSPQNITVVSGTFTLTGLQDGVYTNFSIINNGCTAIDATSKTLVDPATPTLTAGTVINPSTCNGTDGSITFTTNLADGTYSLAYTGAGSPQNITVASGAFTLMGLQDGVYTNFSIISNGCTAIDATSKTLVDPATPTLTVGTVTNPSTCSGADGTIAFTTSLADGTYSLVYTGAGSPQNITVASGAFTLTGLQDGIYANFSITSSGCVAVASTSKTLVDPAIPTLTAGTVTNPSICSGTDGTIAFTTSLPDGTYSLNYTGVGSPKTITVVGGAFSLTGLSSGTYSGFAVSTNGCTGTDATAKTLTDPAAPTLTAGTVTNPTTCLSSDGKIAFTTSLPNGTYTLNYTGTGSPKNITVLSGVFELTGLSDGTFSGFSVSINGCTGTDATTKSLTDPAAPTLTAGTVTNPSTCLSADGSIAFTTSLPNGNYTLNYTGAGSPKSITVVSGAFTLSGLPDGVFSGFSVTTGGCTGLASSSITLTDPATPTITAGTVINPSACNGTDGSIAFTTTLPNGNYTLNYTGSGSPKTVTVVSGTFTLSGLLSGDYSGFSVTAGGCVGIDNTTKRLVNPNSPTISVGTATNPSTCSGTGSIEFTTNLPNGTYNLTYTGSGSPMSVTVNDGTFTLSGLLAGTYSNFSIDNNLGCIGTDATSKTLADPLTPTLTIGTQTNPSTCSGNDGSIAFTTNLPNGTYNLAYTGTGSPKSVTVSSGAFSLSGLSAGTYENFVITVNGCVGNETSLIVLSDPTPQTVRAGSNSAICSGSTLTLTSDISSAVYQWNGPNNFTSTEQNPNIVTATTLASGIYTLQVTVSGCTSTSTVEVFVNPVPTTPTPNAVAPIAMGSSATLTATGCAGTLRWYLSANDNEVTNPVSPTTATDYYAKCEIIQNGTSCLSDKSVNVTVGVIAVQIVYVNATNTNSTQDGTTWATAYADLSLALANARTITNTPVEVWVAKGTYKPTSTINRFIAFNIPSGVKVYGGFNANETSMTQRDVNSNTTILSGEIGNQNTINDNSYHVVVFDGVSQETRLDGFTITKGNADFDARLAVNFPMTSAPLTTTQTRGGGIDLENGSSPSIVNCTIVANAAVSGGGIFAGDNSIPSISFCKITGNQATFGSAMYVQDASNLTVNNTLIAGNRGIGAVYNNLANPVLTNCTLAGNGGYNGGIFNANSQPRIKNSILWGNSAPFNDTQSIITYSIVQNGYQGVGNLNYDPQFVAPTPDGLSPNSNGDYHIKANSLAIDRGDNETISLTDKDLDENLRRYNGGSVDMGAYEYQGNPTATLVISVASGNWESNSTWDIGRVPTLGDYVIIDQNHTISLSTEANAKNLEYRGSGTIQFKSNNSKINLGL